jgi:hypothetical protein
MSYDSEARIALKYFHNESLKYSGYKISFDEMIIKIYKTNSNAIKSLGYLGQAIVVSELSESEIKKLFENLARVGQGRIPSSPNSFFDALRGEVSSVRWSDVKEIIVNSASDVGTGIVKGGQAVIDTASSLAIVLPILVVGAVIFIVIQKTRSVARS